MMSVVEDPHGLNGRERFFKRAFDIVFSLIFLLSFWWLILIAFVLASIDTRQSGIYRQTRVGKDGKLFTLFKIRTMRSIGGRTTTVTTASDTRITRSGRFLRRLKLDELPQLVNILKGDMSFVGPRPDVPGFADALTGDDRIILSVRPGLTGPASIKYRNEEALLAGVEDPEQYNRSTVWPDKVQINKEYIKNWRFRDDLYYLIKSLTG